MLQGQVAAAPAAIRLYLFGSFSIEKFVPAAGKRPAARKPVRLPARKLEALVAYLALNPEPQSREKLAAQFWGDFSDRKARDSLRNALAVLRKYLGEDLLLSTRTHAQLNPAYPFWVDVREFKSQERLSPQAAVELYRADLLTELYDDWVTLEREHCRRLYLDLLLQLARQMRAQGEYAQAIQYARQMLRSDPTNEHAHQNLMFCYAISGDRNSALQQYQSCKTRLNEDLGVKPSPETEALYQWIKRSPSEPASPDAKHTNLPIPLTSFIGRQREIREVKEMLAGTRLLSLTGAGGSGKTRLAMQAANELLEQFRDGVWWVELAPLTDAALLPQAVAKVLGVQENSQQSLLETLANALSGRQLLLALDNCEHLVTASASLAETLLRAGAGVKILTTTREALGLVGEARFLVPTLSLPAGPHLDLAETLMQYEGIRLFVERARSAQAGFELDDRNASPVLEICQRLDGIPLAIELAAARVSSLSAKEIAERLHDRFNLLTGGSPIAPARQHTLRAMMDWSYELLSAAERMLLNRLSVFAGGWTLEAAEAICADEALPRQQILDLLSNLVRKSLVTVQVRESATRYAILDTIRQYAGDKLSQSGELPTMQERHLQFFLDLAEGTSRKLHTAAHTQCLTLLERELDNFRAALAGATQSGQAEAGLRLADALCRFWLRKGHWGEGREWLHDLLANRDASISELTRARTLMVDAILAYSQGYYGEARKEFELALALFRKCNDPAGMAETLMEMGNADFVQGNYAAARSHLESSLAISRTIRFQWVTADALHYLGHVWQGLHKDEQAQGCYTESVSVFRELGDRVNLSYPLSDLGQIALHDGDLSSARAIFQENLNVFQQDGNKIGSALMTADLGYVALAANDAGRAEGYLRESLSRFHELGSRRYMNECLEGLAAAAVLCSNPLRAARIFGAAEALRASTGLALPPYRQAEHDRYSATLRAQLDAAQLARVWAEGQELSTEQIVELALAAGGG